MDEYVFGVSYSSLKDGCPNCKSNNLYLICGEERGAICADCGWHNEGISDEHAQETLKSIRAVEKERDAEKDNIMLCGGEADETGKSV